MPSSPEPAISSNNFLRRAVSALLACATWASTAVEPAVSESALAELGRALFFDRNLSLSRSQSCASCHDPARGFTDSRDNGVGGAVSRGADGRSLGSRHAPSAAYAALVPPLHRDRDGAYVGGLFHDGRARDLADQAGQPILNPLEMQMPDAAAVVARLRENPDYVTAFKRQFGATLFDDDPAAFAALRQALAAFERTPLFLAFDSRYDRYLRGELQLTAAEEEGRTLFFSSLMNCTSCHLNGSGTIDPRETFTDNRYFNVGLPANQTLRHNQGQRETEVDRGLRANPRVSDDAELGKFRVPTLRNVAVTAPYMHNGVFRELRTAIFFYNQHIVENARNTINPETGKPWGPPEVAGTVARERLALGQPLDDERIELVIAFLRALTDQRLEPLLKK